MRWWQALRQAYPKRSALTIAVVTLAVAIVVGGGFVLASNAVLHATATEAFCTSCHEMQANAYAEYKESVHWSTRTGVRPTCADCHIPRELVPMLVRKIEASREVWGHFTGYIDTKEKYEKARYDMAAREWKRMLANDSQECRNCHNVTSVDFSKQGEYAQKRHAMARDQKMTCIECHFSVAHAEPDGPGPKELKKAMK
jgi:cytochrome c-type protein NapC